MVDKIFDIRVCADSEEQALELVGKHCFMFVKEVKE